MLTSCGTQGCYYPILEDCEEQCSQTCFNTSQIVPYNYTYFSPNCPINGCTGNSFDKLTGYYCSDFKEIEIGYYIYGLVLGPVIIFVTIWLSVAFTNQMHCYKFNCCGCLFFPMFLLVYFPSRALVVIIILWAFCMMTMGVLFQALCCNEKSKNFASDYFKLCNLRKYISPADCYVCHESFFLYCMDRCGCCDCLEDKRCYCREITWSSCLKECKLCGSYCKSCFIQRQKSQEVPERRVEGAERAERAVEEEGLLNGVGAARRVDEQRIENDLQIRIRNLENSDELLTLVTEIIDAAAKLNRTKIQVPSEVLQKIARYTRNTVQRIQNNLTVLQVMYQKQLQELEAVLVEGDITYEHQIAFAQECEQEVKEVEEAIYVEVDKLRKLTLKMQSIEEVALELEQMI